MHIFVPILAVLNSVATALPTVRGGIESFTGPASLTFSQGRRESSW
jgi:hypothetical protein